MRTRVAFFDKTKGREMNLTVRTYYDKERLFRFSTYVGLHRIWLWICLSAVTALVTVPFVLQFTGAGIDGKIIFGFIIILLVDIFYLFTYFVLPRLTVNKMPLLGITIEFTFLENRFLMNAISKNGEDKSAFKYIDLNRIAEGKKELFLYITKSQAFIVDKSSLSHEQISELKTHIKNKMNGVKAVKSK